MSSGDQDYQMVDFQTYCQTCKYRDVKEAEDPCNECLEYPINLYSQKPVNWKERDDQNV